MLLVLAGVVVAGVGAWEWLRPRGPVYQGHPVGYWLHEQVYGTNRPEVEKAFRIIGVQAIPYVMAKVRQNDSAPVRLNRSVVSHLPLRQLGFSPLAFYENGHAAFAVRSIGPAAMPAMAAYLRDRKASVRRFTLERFREFQINGYPSLVTAAELVPLLKDADDAVRLLTAQVLAAMGPAAKDALPALISTLRQSDLKPGNAKRIAAQKVYVTALGEIGPAAGAAVPLLTPLLRATNSVTRIGAAIALWRIRHTAADTLPVLISGLNTNGETLDQVAIIETLGDMGPLAASATPALLTMLQPYRQIRALKEQAAKRGTTLFFRGGDPERTSLMLFSSATNALGKIKPHTASPPSLSQ